jgi:hypothetical protein
VERCPLADHQRQRLERCGGHAGRISGNVGPGTCVHSEIVFWPLSDEYKVKTLCSLLF